MRIDAQHPLAGWPRRWRALSLASSLLLCGLAPASGEQTKVSADRAIRWAERLLAKAPATLRRGKDRCLIPHTLLNAEAGFNGVIAKYGATARAYRGLGQCQLRLGKYEGAVQSFERALTLSPSDGAAKAGRDRARQLLKVAQSAKPGLPAGNTVIQAEAWPTHADPELWLVLSAEVTDGAMDRLSDVHLSVMRRSGPGHEVLWRSEALRDPRWDGRGFMDVQVCRLSPASYRTPHVAVWEVCSGGSWAPSHVEVLAWRNGRMTKILGVRSSEPLWIEDLDGDGWSEIGNCYEIGRYMSHAEQPRWTDVYAYRNGPWALANRHFPNEFRGWTTKLQSVLKEYPDDGHIRWYLRYAQEIVRKPQNARALSKYEKGLPGPPH